MKCTTVREGSDCPFMTAKGCSFNGGVCLEALEACDGCNRSKEFPSGWYCTASPDPAAKWKHGHCNLATHVTIATTKDTKVKINPLKASKRAAR